MALELSRILGRSGARVIVAESSGGLLCRSSRFVNVLYRTPSPRYQTSEYISALLKIIQNETVDLIIPTCEEIFFISKFKDRLADECRVFVPEFEMIETLHRKDRFVDLAQSIGLAVPHTAPISLKEGQLSELSIRGDLVVVKPVHTRFGCETHIIHRNEYQSIKALVADGSREWLVQEYLAGSEFHAYAVASNGCVLAMVVYRSLSFRRNGGPCLAFEAVAIAEIEEWVRHFVQKFSFSGQIAFDFITGEDGSPCAVECNPRATSGLHLLAELDGISEAFIDEKQLDLGSRKLRSKGLFLPCLFSNKREHFKDVIFSWDDLLPCLAQIMTLSYFAAKAFLNRMSLGEAMVDDIRWDGESIE